MDQYISNEQFQNLQTIKLKNNTNQLFLQGGCHELITELLCVQGPQLHNALLVLCKEAGKCSFYSLYKIFY